MSAEPLPAVRRIATYERVSSEDQRERETIRTQTGELARRLEREADVQLVRRYADDGISGTIPLAERPAGGQLMRDAAAGRFGEVWVYKLDRLGRDAVDLLVLRRRFLELGIRLISVVEAEPDLLSYDVQAVVADHARREFLRRSADGMQRAAREGRYIGGIVAFGYRIEGSRESARPVPDTRILWGDLSAADIVRRMYGHLGIDGWSCRRVAEELNALGIPTHYARDGRGVRGRRTQGIWRAGHIRNMIVSPIYRGQLDYGRRTKRPDGAIISAPIEGLVSPALWHAAQATLARNRLIPKHGRRQYLLRGTIRCRIDGLAYTGAAGSRGLAHYRCDGKFLERGPLEGRCPGRYVPAAWLEGIVWSDVERWLRDPGDILAELDPARERTAATAVATAESVTLTAALRGLDVQRQRVLGLRIRGHLTDDELDRELDRIKGEKTELEGRLAALCPEDESQPTPTTSLDFLAEIRQRLGAGLSFEQRQEIVQLLTRIVVHTSVRPDGSKEARVAVSYRFPDRVSTDTVTGSSR